MSSAIAQISCSAAKRRLTISHWQRFQHCAVSPALGKFGTAGLTLSIVNWRKGIKTRYLMVAAFALWLPVATH
jgi:hypothetical protein